MKITVLGSGTSTGVPIIGCSCEVCQSNDPHDKRLRASILLTGTQHVLIDSGPDLRQQTLRAGVTQIAGVLYTHFHFDHLDGLPDLRPFTFEKTANLTCFANEQTYKKIREKYSYIRERAAHSNVPHLSLDLFEGSEEKGYAAFSLGGLTIQPIRLVHIPTAGVLSTGFVVNKTFGYLTDFKTIHPDDEKHLFNLKALFLGSPIDREHVSHIQHSEALNLIEKFAPLRGLVGHLSHQYSHNELCELWQGRAEPAFDGLEIEF